MNPKRKFDMSLIIGVFTSSLIVWIFLYNTIVDLTTQEPSALSLIYLGIDHYLAFLCVSLSFIIMLDNGLEIGLEDYEYNRFKKIQHLSRLSRRMLFSLWGLMFIFCIASLLSQNFFHNSRYRFLEENGGLFFGIILCIGIFAILGINVFKLLSHINKWFLVAISFLAILYLLFLSLYAADVKYKVEKDFYTVKDTVRFEVKRKGYIFLPTIRYVLYNFTDTLKYYSDDTYFIPLNKYNETQQSLVEITYSPQVFGNEFRKYIYVNKTP